VAFDNIESEILAAFYSVVAKCHEIIIGLL